MAVELACGADFSLQLICEAGPGDKGGEGADPAKIMGKPDRESPASLAGFLGHRDMAL